MSALGLRSKFQAPEMRRIYEEGQFSSFFEKSLFIKYMIGLFAFGATVAILIYHAEIEQIKERLFLTLMVITVAIAYMNFQLKGILERNSKILLIVLAGAINLFMAKMLYLYVGPYMVTDLPALQQPMPVAIFLVPTAFAPLLITTLLGVGAGTFVVIFLSVLTAILFDNSFQMLIIGLLTGFMGVYYTRDVRKRTDLVRAGVWVGLTSLLCACAFGLIHGIDIASFWGQGIFEAPELRMAVKQAVWGVVIGFVTALVVGGVLPVVESIFKITTNISWLELSDFNHPLLKEMSIRAPGTYHHSLNVANLSESVAEAVKANALECRVCSYFHDIGKMVKPEYFIENSNVDRNPHNKLTPQMSALIISSHVKEGVDMALKHKLSKEIIDVIREHHGTSLITYFYHRAKRQSEDAALGSQILEMNCDDVPEVDENTYRYPGPKPQSKESAIISICDSVEAASRCLQKPTPQRIEDLVDGIIEHKIQDGQFDEADLSFSELRVIRDKLVFMLTNMLHARISYPKPDEDKDQPVEESQESALKPAQA